MRFLFSTILLLILAVPAAVFAVSNREMIVVQVWPLPFEIPIVVYMLVFIPLVLGLLLGGLYAWLLGGKARGRARVSAREAAAHKRRVEALETELENLKSGAKEAEANLPATVDGPGGRAAA